MSGNTPPSLQKKLIVISAPSGAGKTTLCHRLLKDFPILTPSVSSTTRPPRGDEKEGVDYHYLTREQFEKQIIEDRFAEWALVHRNYYGTSKSAIETPMEQGRAVLLDIDVQGAESFRSLYPDETYSIFVSPPSLEELEKRLRARGTDTDEIIHRRMVNAAKEMSEAPRFHAILVNDDLPRAYQELTQIVRKALYG